MMNWAGRFRPRGPSAERKAELGQELAEPEIKSSPCLFCSRLILFARLDYVDVQVDVDDDGGERGPGIWRQSGAHKSPS